MQSNKLDSKITSYFREEFRAARAAALKDAEGFQEICFSLERFGAFLTKTSKGNLGQYKNEIVAFVKDSPLANDIPDKYSEYHSRFSMLYQSVKDGRNSALHQGAIARSLTEHAVQVALVIEDALMQNTDFVRDYMVRDVVCAYMWQPLSFVRQKLLENSFSFLPIWREDIQVWKLLSDDNIFKYLIKDRSPKLAQTIEEAIKNGLDLKDVEFIGLDSKIEDIMRQNKNFPILITDSRHNERILGIITAFDLL